MSRTRQLVLFWAVAAVIAAVEAILAADWLVGEAARGMLYFSVEDVPPVEFALLLGTSAYSGGRPSPVLAGRIRAAAALYHAGKVRKLIVSGAIRPERFSDEVAAMKDGLLALGVPESAIVEDGKVLRTLDSLHRMRDDFGCDGFVVISQPGHCERALYLAEHNGISAIGFAAGTIPELSFSESLFSDVRELLAHVKAVLDVARGSRAKYAIGL